MEKMKEETGTYERRKRNLNGLIQHYQNTLKQSLLNALENFKTEDWTMSINNATPEMWDRLRKKHPALEVPTPTIDESLMKVYLDAAQEEKEMSKEELESQIFYEEEEEDMVGSPKHYNTGNIECIEAIEESMTPEAFKGYLKGNCMKYLWRYDYKGKPAEDLQKAQWYLAKLLQEVVFEGEEKS